MADDGVFATNAQVLQKAGVNASAVSGATAWTDLIMPQVEAFINVNARYNFSDAYAGLNVDVKGVLTEIASNLAAIYVIAYDMSGWDSRLEAEDLINVLRDAALRGLSTLKDRKPQDFMTEA